MDSAVNQPLTIVNALVFDGVSPDLREASIVFRTGIVAAVGDVAPEGCGRRRPWPRAGH